LKVEQSVLQTQLASTPCAFIPVAMGFHVGMEPGCDQLTLKRRKVYESNIISTIQV